MIEEKGTFEKISKHGGIKWRQLYLKIEQHGGPWIPCDNSVATFFMYNEYDEKDRMIFEAVGFIN